MTGGLTREEWADRRARLDAFARTSAERMARETVAEAHEELTLAHVSALVETIGEDRTGKFVCGFAANFRAFHPEEPPETAFLKCFRAHGPYQSAIRPHVRRGVTQ